MVIVEDEKLEREGIVEFFDWNSLDIEIAGTASDGIEGIELAKEIKPDIIMTDIKMPVIDGIEMSKKIREFLPKAKIIVLSGHDDFNYAREAMRFKANAYLLKPIDEKEMLDAVKGVVNECRSELRQSEDEIVIRAMLREEYEQERIKFYMNLLQNKISKEEFEKKAFIYNLNMKWQEYFLVTAVKLDGNNEITLEIITSDLNENLKDNLCFSVFEKNSNNFYLCVTMKDKEDIAVIHGKIKNTAHRLLKIIAVGDFVDHLSEINRSFEAAKEALAYGVFWNIKDTIHSSGIKRLKDKFNESAPEAVIQGNNLSKQLIRAVSSADRKNIQDILAEMFEFMASNKYMEIDYIKNYFNNILYEIFLFLLNMNKESNDGWKSRNDFGSEFLNLDSFEAMKNYVYDSVDKSIKRVEEKRNNKDEHIVSNVIKLLQERYRSELSLKVVAAEVFLSPNYLGSIFKRYTGKGFNEYLSEYRIEKAKELLKNPNKKISSVGKEVGIENTSYFCVVFKNTCGMTPKEYQELNVRS